MPLDVRQYNSALPYINDATASRWSRLHGNISNNDDRVRLKAYEYYEALYHTWPEHIRITVRGGVDDDDEDSIEIYMPGAKKCIEAVNRFLAVNFQIVPDPSVEPAANAAEAATFITSLFRRERMPSKFANLKRYMLIKGDALLHIYANPDKPAGKRICIDELKPEHYFPIGDPVTGETLGCYIVDVIRNPRNTINTKIYTGQELVRRQTYMREFDDYGNPTGVITSALALYEVGKWDERVLPEEEVMLVDTIREEFALPEEINQLPVYHWRNAPPPCSSFGMSELAGVESIANAINQSMSDEDMTLIMQGLGVYWTDASPPLNDKGDEVEWNISPRSVVQVASGGQFNRVSGITTVQPFGDHINALDEAMQQALGLSDVAIGLVNDTSVAESGIALSLKLSPLIAKNKEKEAGDLTNITDQFIYDLINGWLPAYEHLDTEGVVFISQFDDPMPKNKSKDLADLVNLWVQANAGGQVLPVTWLYQQLNEIMGYELSQQDFQEALDEAQQIAEATAPPPPPMPPGGDAVGAGAGANGAPSKGASSNGSGA
jgi:hypothetical protein